MPSASELLAQPSTLLAQVLAFAGNRLSQWAIGDLNFVGKIARMFVVGRTSFDAALRQLDADWPPSNQTSLTNLQRQMETFGLPNNAGGYGFRVAQTAKGGIVEATGALGTVYATGLTLTGPDGTTQYVVVGGPYTIAGIPPGTGQVNITIDAVTAGAVGNLSPPAQLSWDAAPIGSADVVTLVNPVANGLDEESPGDANQRLLNRLQLPPKGGAPQDYRTWGEEATDSNGAAIGGLRFYGYSGGSKNSGSGGGYDGVGGVMGVLTRVGSGLGRMPTAQELIDDLRYIRGTTASAGLSPITSSIRVIAPYMDPNHTGTVTKLRVVPSKPLYAFDWVRGATSYVVDLAASNSLRLTGLAPADLKTAISNGQKPRLWVDTRSGGLPVGQVVPPMARCVAFSDAAGKTTLTLELPLPVGWVNPSPGDEVYSGSKSINDPQTGVGASVLDYYDNLGPSRVSGLQDPNDLWEDTAAPQGGIDAAAKNTLASDGVTPLIASCLPGEVKIGVGTGSLLATNVQAEDNSIFGPSLLYALRILVTD